MTPLYLCTASQELQLPARHDVYEKKRMSTK